MTITNDRPVFSDQDGTPEDAERTVTPALPIPPAQKADMDAAHAYIDTLPVALRGRELAQHVVYITETFPEYHDQRVSCSNNAACLVGWTDVLAYEPLADGDAITSFVNENTRYFSGGQIADKESGLSDIYNAAMDDQGMFNGPNPVTYAAEMLNIPGKASQLQDYVYDEYSRETAIHNFKVLTGLMEGDLQD